MSLEKDKAYFRGGYDILAELIEFCGMFPDRVPSKNGVQTWLVDASIKWISIARENGMWEDEAQNLLSCRDCGTTEAVNEIGLCPFCEEDREIEEEEED